jgi:hypothetical protein
MNPLLKNFSLHAGGAHYPEINPNLQEAFAKMIIETCAELANRESSAPFDTYGDLIRDYFGIEDGRKTNN